MTSHGLPRTEKRHFIGTIGTDYWQTGSVLKHQSLRPLCGLKIGSIIECLARLLGKIAADSPEAMDDAIESALPSVEFLSTEERREFARTLRQQQRELSTDDGQSILDRQCEKRRAKMFESREDGMFVVSGEFDPITGNRIALAISDKERELWRKEDPKNRRTPQQRMADALAELILEPESGQPPRTALLVIADYDAVHRELVNARLNRAWRHAQPPPAWAYTRVSAKPSLPGASGEVHDLGPTPSSRRSPRVGGGCGLRRLRRSGRRIRRRWSRRCPSRRRARG